MQMHVHVKPARDYFKLKFDKDLKPALKAFKAARLFSPSKINAMKPSPSDVGELCVLLNNAFKFSQESALEDYINDDYNYSRFS